MGLFIPALLLGFFSSVCFMNMRLLADLACPFNDVLSQSSLWKEQLDMYDVHCSCSLGWTSLVNKWPQRRSMIPNVLAARNRLATREIAIQHT